MPDPRYRSEHASDAALMRASDQALYRLLEPPPPRGLGDTLARVSRFFGFRASCSGCAQRREWLNKWCPFQRTAVTPQPEVPQHRSSDAADLHIRGSGQQNAATMANVRAAQEVVARSLQRQHNATPVDAPPPAVAAPLPAADGRPLRAIRLPSKT